MKELKHLADIISANGGSQSGIDYLLDLYRIDELPVDIQEAAEGYLRYKEELEDILFPDDTDDEDDSVITIK